MYFDYNQNAFNLDARLPCEFIGPDESEVTYFFENMCCTDIPAPFQLGDVLTIPEKSQWEDDQIFVLKPPNDREQKRLAQMKEFPYNEYIDVNTDWGYVVSSAGVLYGDHIGRADFFEYYRGKYKGTIRLLHYVSLYLKGKLDLPEMLTMQCRIFLESQLDQELDYQNHGCFITDDLLAENQLTEMGELKRYYVNVRTITVSEKWNFRIRVTPAYNRNELPYFEVVTPGGLWLPQEPSRSAYFHFKDSQMEFFKNGDLQWEVLDDDIEHIREVLQKDNATDRDYTNWQMACYWWNIEHNILDFGTPPDQYFQGLFDKANEKNRSYIPHDQQMPETWIYAPPRKIKKRMIII